MFADGLQFVIAAVRDKALRAGKVLCQRETRRRELLDEGVYLFQHFSHRDALFRVWFCGGREDTIQLGQHRPRRGNGIGRIDLCGLQFLCQILRELPVSCQRFFSQQKPQQDADGIHVCRRGQTKWLAAAGTGKNFRRAEQGCGVELLAGQDRRSLTVGSIQQARRTKIQKDCAAQRTGMQIAVNKKVS